MELPFVELTEEMDRQLSAPRRAAAPAAAPGGGPGAANALPQPAELDEATDRAVGEALRKGAEARKPRS